MNNNKPALNAIAWIPALLFLVSYAIIFFTMMLQLNTITEHIHFEKPGWSIVFFITLFAIPAIISKVLIMTFRKKIHSAFSIEDNNKTDNIITDYFNNHIIIALLSGIIWGFITLLIILSIMNNEMYINDEKYISAVIRTAIILGLPALGVTGNLVQKKYIK